MCGILLCHDGSVNFDNRSIEFPEGTLTQDTQYEKYLPNELNNLSSMISYIQGRGPNYSSIRSDSQAHTAWFSSILSLRKPFTKQSVLIDDKYVLQFNGELYNDEIKHNDTQFIISALHNGTDPIDAIRNMEGEFAYTIFDLLNNKIYFGRDSIGKRSLSYFVNEELDQLYISSITGKIDSVEFQNCIAGTIYIYDVTNKSLDSSNNILPAPFTVTIAKDPEFKELDTIMNSLWNKLNDSISKRINSIHPTHIENSPIAVLFSGGLDCTVIVAMIAEQLMKNGKTSTVIELLNVGFENPRTGLFPKDTPDRKLAISSAGILRQLYPEINIKLVEIDIPYDAYLKYRPQVIDMMHPKQTEMDLSIAIAFFFASKGQGFVTNNQEKQERIPYQRQGIVLFSGLGADELYGGYHKFANKTAEELQEELTRQINNIHDRNLNRDDKVIASNGVEVRYPFLDEDVIRFSTEEIPINYKVNKLILRKVASDKLSLGTISEEPKRAIQFGSKSAKMTKDGNKNGTDLLK